ncbi:hypothetical protein BKA69DRAFT_251644 [Paraphysoderma sedebokerense]|nr:hypothetical protein BKA69DRAFT_251644 [Paraphysoderma sedebokerense]
MPFDKRAIPYNLNNKAERGKCRDYFNRKLKCAQIALMQIESIAHGEFILITYDSEGDPNVAASKNLSGVAKAMFSSELSDAIYRFHNSRYREEQLRRRESPPSLSSSSESHSSDIQLSEPPSLESAPPSTANTDSTDQPDWPSNQSTGQVRSKAQFSYPWERIQDFSALHPLTQAYHIFRAMTFHICEDLFRVWADVAFGKRDSFKSHNNGTGNKPQGWPRLVEYKPIDRFTDQEADCKIFLCIVCLKLGNEADLKRELSRLTKCYDNVALLKMIGKLFKLKEALGAIDTLNLDPKTAENDRHQKLFPRVPRVPSLPKQTLSDLFREINSDLLPSPESLPDRVSIEWLRQSLLSRPHEVPSTGSHVGSSNFPTENGATGSAIHPIPQIRDTTNPTSQHAVNPIPHLRDTTNSTSQHAVNPIPHLRDTTNSTSQHAVNPIPHLRDTTNSTSQHAVNPIPHLRDTTEYHYNCRTVDDSSFQGMLGLSGNHVLPVASSSYQVSLSDQSLTERRSLLAPHRFHPYPNPTQNNARNAQVNPVLSRQSLDFLPVPNNTPTFNSQLPIEQSFRMASACPTQNLYLPFPGTTNIDSNR